MSQSPIPIFRLNATARGTSIADSDDGTNDSHTIDAGTEDTPQQNWTLNGDTREPNFPYSKFPISSLKLPPTIDYQDPDSIGRFPAVPVHSRALESFRDLFQDNVYFRTKLMEMEQKCEELETRVRAYHSLTERATTHIDLEPDARFQQQELQILSLRRKCQSHDYLGPFFETEGKPHQRKQIYIIQRDYGQMSRGLSALGRTSGFQAASTQSGLDSKDLKTLKCRVFGGVPSTTHYWRACQDPGLLFQSLAAAAVCEWVFEGESICTSMMPSPLLNEYRKHVGASD